MANTTKITKKDRFMELKALVKDNAELVAFIDHEIELLNKKAENRGNGKKAQAENFEKAYIKELVLSALAELGQPATITEMQGVGELAGYSNQKISALVKQLVECGSVTRTVEKGKARFSLV